MVCPKCGTDGHDGAETCASCGLIFARYDPAGMARHRAARDARHAALSGRRRGFALVAAAALALVVTGLWWSGRTPAQAYVAPTGGGRMFAGLAHGYTGKGAELFLVKAGHTVQVIGRIDPGGRFGFELPAALSLPRLPQNLQLQLDGILKAGGEANAARRDRILRWRDSAEASVHALHAGETWVGLEVSPVDMTVARYAVAYADDAGQGDLFAANEKLGLVATPGQAMVVLVYANRAGRVRGKAYATNAFGTEVLHPWDMDLQAGWNLVTSEQNADMATLQYRTGPLPSGLQWWTLAGG